MSREVTQRLTVGRVDGMTGCVAFCWHMTKKSSAPAATLQPKHPLAEILERLANELQLTRQALDELRTDVQWALQNCLIRSAGPAGEPDSPSRDSATDSKAINLLPTFEEGDAVVVNHNGHELFGEVISIDDAENLAEVLLIPSNETLTVIQDNLSRVQPDSLRRLCPEPASCVVPNAPITEAAANTEPASSGRLF